MSKFVKGFTLIEVMITVAIIGTLAALAVPAYQSYVIRGRVTEGLTLVEGAKSIVATDGRFSTTRPSVAYPQRWNAQAGGMGAASKYVTSLVIANPGVITLTFNSAPWTWLLAATQLFCPLVRAASTGTVAAANRLGRIVLWACASTAQTNATATARWLDRCGPSEPCLPSSPLRLVSDALPFYRGLVRDKTPRLSPVLFHQPHARDRHAAIHRFAHVVDRQ